jgi:hypothetical protein
MNDTNTPSVPFFIIKRTLSQNFKHIGAKLRHRDIAAIVLGWHEHNSLCYPSNKYLSESTGIHVRTITDVISDLNKNGLIDITYSTESIRYLSPLQPLKNMNSHLIKDEKLKNSFKSKRQKNVDNI